MLRTRPTVGPAHLRARRIPSRTPTPGSTTRPSTPEGRRLYIAHLGDSTLDRSTSTLRVHRHDRARDRRDTRRRGRSQSWTRLRDRDRHQRARDHRHHNRPNRRHAHLPVASPTVSPTTHDDGLVFVSNKNDGTITVDHRRHQQSHRHDQGRERDRQRHLRPTTQDRLHGRPRAPDTLVAIDPTSRKVTSRVRLSGCKTERTASPSTPGTDSRSSRASATHASSSSRPSNAEDKPPTSRSVRAPDVLAYDALHRLYVIRSGVVTVFAPPRQTRRRSNRRTSPPPRTASQSTRSPTASTSPCKTSEDIRCYA